MNNKRRKPLEETLRAHAQEIVEDVSEAIGEEMRTVADEFALRLRDALKPKRKR